jgi:glycosyltransferase involved in cell wall biosynthesis
MGVDSVLATTEEEFERALSVKPDIVHIHGIWHWFYHKALRSAKEKNIKIVYSTHGMTSPWALRNNWWKKLPAWFLYQKKDFNMADAIHSTSSMEESWNKNLIASDKIFFKTPLGTDEQKFDSKKPDSNTILFVGRISKVKSLDVFIKAIYFHRMENPQSKLIFRIVGPDERNCTKDIKKLVSKLKLGDVVEFCGYMDKMRLSAEYENALALVVPSKSENFCAAVIEALSHGTVVVASKNTPWDILPRMKCGWHVEGDVMSFKTALDSICDAKADGSIIDMQSNAINLVESSFRWPKIVETIYSKYLEIVEKDRIADGK